jgi:chemotaxis protein MotB
MVKRRSAHEEEHHGGAWKIAFADFMTAMMAFFLVLWIISATDKNTKTLIARYFNPVKVEEPAKAQKGIHGAPEKGAVYAPEDGNGAPDAGRPSSEHGEGPAEKGNENPASPSKQNEQARPPTPSPLPPPDPAKPYPTMSEQELFSDPRASLDKIAGAPPPGPRIDLSAALKGYGEVGPSADEALRDPFRPLGSDQAVNVVAENPGAPPAAAAPSDESPSTSTAIAPAARRRAPLKLKEGPKPRARAPLLRQRRVRRLPTPSRRVRQPRRALPTSRGVSPESPSRCKARNSISRRPKMGSLSALPTGRISPCSPSARLNRSPAFCT